MAPRYMGTSRINLPCVNAIESGLITARQCQIFVPKAPWRRHRVRSTLLSCTMELNPGQLAVVSGSSAFAQAKFAYLQAQHSHPVITDGLTAGILYSISDLFAQWQTDFLEQYRARAQKPPPDASQTTSQELLELQTTECSTQLAAEVQINIDTFRTARYGVFGLVDGSLSHYWFEGLESLIPASDFQAVAEKMAIDCAFFTPTWSAAFLLFMALTEGAGVQGAAERVRNDWKALYLGNVAAWLPANAVLYGVVPLQQRVLAFASFTLLYTIVLSWWAEDPERARCESGVGACEVPINPKAE